MRVWMALMFLGSLMLTACGSRCPAGTYDNGTTCTYQSSAYPYSSGTTYNQYPQTYYPQQTYNGSGYYTGY